MTDGEFEGVLTLWAAYWPSQATIPEGLVAAAWRDLWADYTAEEVRGGLRELATAAREFPPPPGVVAKAAHDWRVMHSEAWLRAYSPKWTES